MPISSIIKSVMWFRVETKWIALRFQSNENDAWQFVANTMFNDKFVKKNCWELNEKCVFLLFL